MIPSFEQRHSRGGRACPEFGGGGGASSNTTKTENSDSRISQQSGNAVSGDNNTLTVLDGGAIKNAFDFASAGQSDAFKFAATSQASAISALTTTSKLVSDAYNDAKGRGAMTDWVLLGALAVAGVAAIAAARS